MPTLECLDERTRLVLEKLDDMDGRFSASQKQFKEEYIGRESSVDEKLSELEKQIVELKIVIAKDDGRKSVTMWLGASVMAMGGAMANTFFVWFLGPHGPLNK